MKKVILESYQVRFKFYSKTDKCLFTSHTEIIKPDTKISLSYNWGLFPSYNFEIEKDLVLELEKKIKLCNNIKKLAKNLLIKNRKSGYNSLNFGTAVTGKHIIKVMFEFVDIKYRVEKVK